MAPLAETHSYPRGRRTVGYRPIWEHQTGHRRRLQTYCHQMAANPYPQVMATTPRLDRPPRLKTLFIPLSRSQAFRGQPQNVGLRHTPPHAEIAAGCETLQIDTWEREGAEEQQHAPHRQDVPRLLGWVDSFREWHPVDFLRLR